MKRILSNENIHVVTMLVLLVMGLINMLPSTMLSLIQVKIGPLTIQVILGSLAVFLALYDLLGRIEEDREL